MELGEDLLVLIIAKAHDVTHSHLLALLNHKVEHSVVEVLIVFTINVPHLYNGHHVLSNQLGVPYYGLVKISMEVTPKPCL
jgi:hypothetical protein